jgi:CRP/FNR family cyclic AMP-dependent transcriptional regulator
MTRFVPHPSVLRRLPPFSWLSASQITSVLPWIEYRTFPARHSILRVGDRVDGLYILLSGSIQLVHEDREGREFIAAQMGSNEFFGELGLLDGDKSPVTIRAQEACETLFISRDLVLQCLEDNPRAAMCMLRKVAARLCDSHRKMATLALMTVYSRVARFILENSSQTNGALRLKTGSEQMARTIGASREMVSRVVREMVQKGIVRRCKRELIVLDLEGLKEQTLS